MVKKNKDILNKKIQKNRFFKNPKESFNKFGDFGLACRNEGRLELIHISMIKKKIKPFIRKKKSEIDIIREKIWYFGRPNFFIQKKSKNSRMGKGKGLIERKVIRVRKNFILLEFMGIPILKLHKLVKYLNKVLSVKMYLIKNYNHCFSLWSKNNKYVTYHDKYLFQ